MKPNQPSMIQGKSCGPEQAQAEMGSGEPNAEELALVTRSFVRCLVERGYGSRDLIEAALLLLDGAIKEIHPAEAPEATEAPSKRASKVKSGPGRRAAKKLVAALR